MPAKNYDLHGNAPDKSSVALLLIDLINDFEYPGGEELFTQALPIAERIRALKRRAKEAGIPIIYVNDNFGKWQSDFHKQVEHCLKEDVRGAPIVQMLQPDAEDYFVLKPKHSAFYATPLDILLDYLKVNTLVLTGVTGDLCVLFTAGDAFLRDFHLFVPSDCVASLDAEENQRCLAHMEKNLDADIRPSAELDLPALKAETGKQTAKTFQY